MRVVRVVGYQDAGKTTVIEELLPLLGKAGRVATVKSIHHDVEVDTPEKDTHRHRTAGAETVVGMTPTTTFSIRGRGKEDGLGLTDVIANLEAKGYDYVIVEGFKDVPLPAILVGEISEDGIAGEAIYRTEGSTAVDIEALAEAVRSAPIWG